MAKHIMLNTVLSECSFKMILKWMKQNTGMLCNQTLLTDTQPLNVRVLPKELEGNISRLP